MDDLASGYDYPRFKYFTGDRCEKLITVQGCCVRPNMDDTVLIGAWNDDCPLAEFLTPSLIVDGELQSPK